jgi:predicted nucleotidyltransferase
MTKVRAVKDARPKLSKPPQILKGYCEDFLTNDTPLNKRPFDEMLKLIISTILKSGGEKCVKKIYLFGSFAYGKPNTQSDIDICVVIGNRYKHRKANVKMASALYRNNIIPLDLIVYNENYFSEKKEEIVIINTISNKGQIIYG